LIKRGNTKEGVSCRKKGGKARGTKNEKAARVQEFAGRRKKV